MQKDIPIFAKLTAELIGTFAIVFAGCGAIMVSERFPGSVPAGAIPVVFGLAVAAMIYALGHISGAHFNPAVSFAFSLARHFPRRQLFGYWAAQCLGATLAMLVLHWSLPAGTSYGATVAQVGIAATLVWEAVLSFFLMFVIVSVATDTRAVGTMAGAAIGATVMLAAFVGGPVSGASMNPARTLGPALFEGRLDTFWMYCAGPAVGAGLAALAYNAIRCHPSKDARGCC